MRSTIINLMEMILGAVILGAGLLYLSSQIRTITILNEAVTEQVVKVQNIREQYDLVDIEKITDEELCTIVIGYREYLITIDGYEIPTDGNDYEYYLSLIKEGNYKKEYEFNNEHEIKKLMYQYIG